MDGFINFFFFFSFTGVIVVVKMEGTSYLCKTDEVGEICVNSGATASQYWGLQGLTNNTFKVQPLQADGALLGDAEYTRSGLLGFLGPVSGTFLKIFPVGLTVVLIRATVLKISERMPKFEKKRRSNSEIIFELKIF